MYQKFKLLLIFIILIGLPAFAWYFLESGTAMRKEAMEALKPKIGISHFQNVEWHDTPVTEDSLKGKRWMVAILGADSANREHVQTLLKLNKQSEVEFTLRTFVLAGMNSGETAEYLNAHLSVPVNDPKWLVSYMAAEHVFPFTEQIFSTPADYQKQSIVVLLDDKQQIRNYYKLSDPDDLKNLVRHLPVFLSLKK